MTYPRAALNGQPTILLTATENTATLGKMDILLHKASHYTCISFHSGKSMVVVCGHAGTYVAKLATIIYVQLPSL